MLCENHSTCGCIFDVLVGEGELHISLLCHFDTVSVLYFRFSMLSDITQYLSLFLTSLPVAVSSHIHCCSDVISFLILAQ